MAHSAAGLDAASRMELPAGWPPPSKLDGRITLAPAGSRIVPDERNRYQAASKGLDLTIELRPLVYLLPSRRWTGPQ